VVWNDGGSTFPIPYSKFDVHYLSAPSLHPCLSLTQSLYALSPLLAISKIQNPQSQIQNQRIPSFFTTFWGFFPQMGKVMVNANPGNYLLYFGHLPVFLKASSNPKGKISNDPEFKR
jgi:hypothetical protein